MNETIETFCPNCGYSLRGIDSERCPECGHAVDPASTPSRIPWVHRRAIGRFRAYWRTVWLVTFHPDIVGSEIQRPASFIDARKFRRMTTWIAFVPLALVAAAGFFTVTFGQPTTPSAAWHRGSNLTRYAILVEWLVLPICWAAIYLFVVAISGIHTYFFHPRSLPVIQQNRAIALGFYACAPLAWTPFTVAILAMYFALVSVTGFRMPLLLMALVSMAVFGVVAIQIVTWWLACLRMVKRTIQCSSMRVITMAVTLPFLWLLLLILIPLGIPAAYVYICVIVISLL